jgi:RimJ/RimL family protein N-acetyltransferase
MTTPTGSRPAPVLPVVLENAFVRLEPFEEGHRPALIEAGADPRVWAVVPLPAGGLSAYLDAALAAKAPDAHMPFVVVERATGAVVGMTRLFDIRPADAGLEIGYTWYRPEAWGGAVNPAAKRLLLGHAFDTLGYERVQLKTDVLNTRSQAAIAKLGGVREGVLRRSMRLPTGRLRDTVYFSILRDEWPAARDRLDARLVAFGAP